MKKKIKDCTKEQIYKTIYKKGKTSVARNNCHFCKYYDLGLGCKFVCENEYETCIDYESIINLVGDEEIEVEEDD